MVTELHRCKQALRLAADWADAADDGTPPDRVRAFDCSVTDAPYDLAVVECAKEHRHGDTAFVWRRPDA